jgi:rhodanese-related sulfurtransferase
VIAKLRALFGRSPAISVTQAPQAISDGALLLDVRELDEWRAGHAPQAQHIPLGQLETRLEEIPAGRPIVAVCRSGRRSAIAANVLNGRGYHATNLTGGMTAWAAAGLPVVSTRNKPGRIT